MESEFQPPLSGVKRQLTEMERQQQLQHALFLRSVKQRTHLASPISTLSPTELSDLSAVSSCSSGFGQKRAEFSFSPPPPPEPNSAMRNRLEELERQLLDDDDDGDEDVVTASGSAIDAEDWIEKLISPTPNPLSSPSPTNSSSSSSASCSPSSSPTPSRQLLIDTAAAIADGNLETAAANLAVLKRAANPNGDADQRLTSIMASALLSRIGSSPHYHHQIADLCGGDHKSATQKLYDLSPCFKLAILSSNLAILDAARDAAKIHIVDFDVGQGGQYAALIQFLAERRMTHRPPTVKITAVCDPVFAGGNSSDGNLRTVGDWLARLAERAGVGLRFIIVGLRPADLDRAKLCCEPEETLAVNLAFLLSRVADESVSPENPRDEVLRRVRALSPSVVTVAEQEINANTAPFAARFGSAVRHYGSILESLEATTGRENPERGRVEACLARKAANIIAREGCDRVERCEVFGKWRARFGMAGFKPYPLGPDVVDPVKNRFGSFKANPGFTVKEEAGGLCFGWMGHVLTVASAWR